MSHDEFVRKQADAGQAVHHVTATSHHRASVTAVSRLRAAPARRPPASSNVESTEYAAVEVDALLPGTILALRSASNEFPFPLADAAPRFREARFPFRRTRDVRPSAGRVSVPRKRWTVSRSAKCT